MSYDSDKKPNGLSTLTTLENNDTIIVGDTSDPNEVVKTISWANIKTLVSTLIEGLSSYFNVTTNTSDDITEGTTNYFVTPAEKTVIGNTSGTNTGDQDLSGYTSNTDTDVSSNSWVIDEDNMASDSATKVPTQQSVKAYVDNNAGSVDDTAYGAGWNGVTGTAPSKNAVYDEMELKQDILAEGAFIDGDKTKLDSIETGADVTDTANVTAAGALMDSEVTNLAAVKAFDPTDYQPTLSEGNFANGDKTKLDGIEASADVTDTANVTSAGALMDSELTDITFVKALSDADVSAVNTGTSTTAVPTADSLAGSYAGTKSVQMVVFDFGTDVATGDGKFYFNVPAALNGMDIVSVHARVITAGTTGTTDIQLHNVTDAVDILSTKLTIDSGETGSNTAATAAVINTSNDSLATNDVIRVDIDAVSTTAPEGLIVTFEARLP